VRSLQLVEGHRRPRDREQCVDGPRPCPWVSCRYHLLLDVSSKTGKLKLNFGTDDPSEIPETCSLDVATRGAETLDVVGAAISVTRERARQIEAKAMAKMAAHPVIREIAEDIGVSVEVLLAWMGEAAPQDPQELPGTRVPRPPPEFLRRPLMLVPDEDDAPPPEDVVGCAPDWRPAPKLSAWVRLQIRRRAA